MAIRFCRFSDAYDEGKSIFINPLAVNVAKSANPSNGKPVTVLRMDEGCEFVVGDVNEVIEKLSGVVFSQEFTASFPISMHTAKFAYPPNHNG